MFSINFNEENIFTLLLDFHMELQKHLPQGNIIDIFSDEKIRSIVSIYTNFRQRILKLYGNIIRKNLTDLYWTFIFGKLPPHVYYLKFIYSCSQINDLNKWMKFVKRTN
jgi:hypothetical protein